MVLFFGLIAALTAANVYLLARLMGVGVGAALTITAALALTNPLLSYSFLIFPELPAALLTIYPFRRLLMPSNNRWQGSPSASRSPCCPGCTPGWRWWRSRLESWR